MRVHRKNLLFPSKTSKKNDISVDAMMSIFDGNRVAGVYKIDKKTHNPVIKYQDKNNITFHRDISRPKPHKVAFAIGQVETFRKNYIVAEQIFTDGFRDKPATDQEKDFIATNIESNLRERVRWLS